MTKTELDLLLAFIDDLGRRLGNAGCNDLTLEDTQENRTLVIAAEQHGMGKDARNKIEKTHGGKIITYDHVVLSYLKSRLEEDYK